MHSSLRANLNRIDLQDQPLNLELTFTCGQAFRWRKLPDGLWRGVVCDKLVELTVQDGYLLWRTFPEADSGLVENYLRLSDDVNAIYGELSSRDSHLASLIERFHGLRLLRQDPTETLLSFVCSAANSIPRIVSAIEKLAAHYGDLVCEHDSEYYYTFPPIRRLAEADPDSLSRKTSLGFRGSTLKAVAQQVLERENDWLLSLRDASYTEARSQLTALRGVGSKIADCVCLFSLDKNEAVPVDTHVRKAVQRLGMLDLSGRSVTETVYRRIAEVFAERYGVLAGWAQQFLYYEDLIMS